MVNQKYITDNSVIRDRVSSTGGTGNENKRAERVQRENIHNVTSMSELDSLFHTVGLYKLKCS